jgi:hypothetical protein
MRPTRALSLAALILAGTALSGFSDTLLALAPEPVAIAPLELALAPAPSASVFAVASSSASPTLGSLTPPLLETDAQRSLRLAAESLAKVGAVFVPDCPADIQVRLVGCPDFRPSSSR